MKDGKKTDFDYSKRKPTKWERGKQTGVAGGKTVPPRNLEEAISPQSLVKKTAEQFPSDSSFPLTKKKKKSF